ncbi:MAG: hypothetical protein K9M02_05155 [Thiohalocapsa sp.]|nr:hypothetical protein [Thiohalocapsa sp.]
MSERPRRIEDVRRKGFFHARSLKILIEKYDKESLENEVHTVSCEKEIDKTDGFGPANTGPDPRRPPAHAKAF